MRIGIVRTIESPCQCAQSVIRGLEALGQEFILADSKEKEFRACELARKCDLVIDHTDTFRKRGLCWPLVRLRLEMEGARVVGSDSLKNFRVLTSAVAERICGSSIPLNLKIPGIPWPPGVLPATICPAA